MPGINELRDRLAGVFEAEQAQALAEVIQEAFNQMVKAGDFNDLKTIVKDLAEAQQHTERRMEDLVLAQQQTELAVQKMLISMNRTRDEIGSVSLSLRHVLENY